MDHGGIHVSLTILYLTALCIFQGMNTYYDILYTATLLLCRYQWLVSDRSQLDCIVDHKAEHKSELLAITTSLDCHWYSVSEAPETCQQKDDQQETSTESVESEEDSESISVELLAVLKRADLSTRLRKIDFRK